MAERTGEPASDRAYADRDEGRNGVGRHRYDDRDCHDERNGAVQERTAGPGVVQQRQRNEYGGFNFGAAFFGWLVAVGMAVLLTALLSAAGAAIGLTNLTEGEAKSHAGTISIVGGILLIVVLALSYYAGGYVAGRMSRFDGGRQGLGVWIMGLLVTIALAVLGAIAGSEWNLFSQVNLPRIPIDEGSLATGTAITLVLILIGTLVAAIVGGKAGERYHRKVDRAGYEGAAEPRRRAATA